MKIEQFLEKLWDDYSGMNPQAGKIHRLLVDRHERIINDHVAFRTFDFDQVNIDVLSRPFLEWGYRPGGEYHFAEKKLKAVHLEHPDRGLPKIFISELKTREFSPSLQKTVLESVQKIPPQKALAFDFLISGRFWEISYPVYGALEKESEYAAWMYAFGFRTNHFTVSVNALRTFQKLGDLNFFLKKNGFSLNSSGGEIKGSSQEHLEQSSTLAEPIAVEFKEGVFKIPSCYYEFALRYPLSDGTLFQGFVTKSADKIFESTNRS